MFTHTLNFTHDVTLTKNPYSSLDLSGRDAQK